MGRIALVILLGTMGVGCGGAQAAPNAQPTADSGFDAAQSPATSSDATPQDGAGANVGDAASAGGVEAPPTESPVAGRALEMPCRKQAREVEGEENSSRLVRCPAGCAEQPGTVWGTDVYTDDSAVCPALIHAGVLAETGGLASITFVRGLRAYVGSEQNGVKSVSYGQWRRSFYGQALDRNGKPSTPSPELTTDGSVRVDCSHRGNLAGGKPGDELIVICPEGCNEVAHHVWGSGPYTGDSNICAAAIHAGAIPAGGGRLQLTLVAGEKGYTATEQHGVKTSKWGAYGVSFTVAAKP